MDLFRDKTYEDMDDISKLVEPPTWSFLDFIHNLPETIEIREDHLRSSMHYAGFYSSTIEGTISAGDMIGKQPWYNELDYTQRMIVNTVYKLELVNDQNFIVNLKEDEVGGKLILVKNYKPLEEKNLMELLGYKCNDILGKLTEVDTETVRERYREILDLLGDNEGMKFKSLRKKANNIAIAFKKAYTTDAWRIRNIDLSNKMAKWVVSYINTGDLSALANFCKVKAMAHKNVGSIYSIEEES